MPLSLLCLFIFYKISKIAKLRYDGVKDLTIFLFFNGFVQKLTKNVTTAIKSNQSQLPLCP